MVGLKTRKVVEYASRKKMCRFCDVAKSKNTSPKPHDCRKNWEGSAKAMEPDMVVAMVSKAKSPAAEVHTLVGDEDASTIAKVHALVDPTVEKRSDTNHIKKILGNDLYALQKEERFSDKTLNYILKIFSYMCQANQGNAEGIRQGLKSLSAHPFGDHSFCSTSWCRFIDNPNSKYSALPYGKPLSNPTLQARLVTIYQNLTNKLKEHLKPLM